jgi:hypothetical protein
LALNVKPAWEKIIGADGLVETIWPEVAITMTGDQADRFNWRELLDKLESGDEDLGLAVPFVVMQVGPAIESTDNPVCTTENYAHPISLHYVRSNHLTEGEETAESTIAELLVAKLEAMRDAIRAGGHSDFQVMRRPTLDVGDNNPANIVFLDGGHPYQAGTITFVAEIWQ